MVFRHPPRVLLAFFALHLLLCYHQYASADADNLDNVIAEDAPPSKKIDEEEDEIGYVQSLIVDADAVATTRSAYQDIAVYDSRHFGKVFLLDDCLQLTERDAPHYNEMLAHVPVMELLAQRDKKDLDRPIKVLVVGGGDGYVVSELLKHPQITSVDHIELDKEVINVAKQHLPWGDAWKSERVRLVIADGAAFVKELVNKDENYDVIIQDASDPFYVKTDGSVVTLPSSVLYGTSHFESLYKLLKPNEGVLVFQAETYNIPSNLESIREWRNVLADLGFATPRYGSISISTYPTGQIGFFIAHTREGDLCKSEDACRGSEGAKTQDRMDRLTEINWNRIFAQFDKMSEQTRYYHPRIHRSSFDLPLWVEEYIYGGV